MIEKVAKVWVQAMKAVHDMKLSWHESCSHTFAPQRPETTISTHTDIPHHEQGTCSHPQWWFCLDWPQRRKAPKTYQQVKVHRRSQCAVMSVHRQPSSIQLPALPFRAKCRIGVSEEHKSRQLKGLRLRLQILCKHHQRWHWCTCVAAECMHSSQHVRKECISGK